MQAKEAGHQAAIIFVAQREDARAFSPEDEADPEFGRKLRDAARRGVEVYAHNCRVSLHSIELFQEIPVYL
jgi:sugar fermentation stimulation protein A